MTKCLVNSYYALVWNDSLKRKMRIKGELITRNTVLPDDPRMLYGTNSNDIAKIRNVGLWQEIEYDTITTKQSVKFWREVDEYILSRDVYILVWEGEEYLELPNDRYKIVSPDLFKYIVQTAPEESCELNIEEVEEEVGNRNSVKEILSNIINSNNIKAEKGELDKDEGFKFSSVHDGKITVQLMMNY